MVSREDNIASMLELADEMLGRLGMRSEDPLAPEAVVELDERVATIGERALCIATGHDFFGPDRPTSFTRATCGSCDARPECFVEALTSGTQYGARAGTNMTARMQTRAHLGISQHRRANEPQAVVNALNAALSKRKQA